MTSSNGNIFRVTGHLCGEVHGPRWIPHTTTSDAELCCFLWSAPEKGWVNNGVTGNLRRYRVHDDVTVIGCQNVIIVDISVVQNMLKCFQYTLFFDCQPEMIIAKNYMLHNHRRCLLVPCTISTHWCHYIDVIVGAMASQITSLTVVYSTVYSGADQRKHQSSASLAFVRGIHRGPVNYPHKWPVARKMFPFDDVIMIMSIVIFYGTLYP